MTGISSERERLINIKLYLYFLLGYQQNIMTRNICEGLGRSWNYVFIVPNIVWKSRLGAIRRKDKYFEQNKLATKGRV